MNKEKKYHCFFNGDADGICSVLQFIRSNFIIDSFFTSYKRDQALLRHGKTLKNANILVFDLELAKNIASVKKILDNGCNVTWFDHHGKDEKNIFLGCANFSPNIDTSSNTNTSLIVYKFFNNSELLKWAIVGLFGDNIDNIALSYCKSLNLSAEEILILTDLGKLINYNSYGENLNDLIMDPYEILNQAKHFKDPITFNKQIGIVASLKQNSLEDLESALSHYKEGDNIVFLPNLPWAKRVYGMFGNYLTKYSSTEPFAVLVDIGEDNYLVSVRAPLTNPIGAGDLCSLFPTGGGRGGAGGINRLHKDYLNKFIQAFQRHFLYLS